MLFYRKSVFSSSVVSLCSSYTSCSLAKCYAWVVGSLIIAYLMYYPRSHRSLAEITTFFIGRLLFVFQLSAYVLHTLPVHWPNAVPELMATLQPSNLPDIPPERTAWILLEILTVLPEEVRAICVFRINFYKCGCQFIWLELIRVSCMLIVNIKVGFLKISCVWNRILLICTHDGSSCVWHFCKHGEYNVTAVNNPVSCISQSLHFTEYYIKNEKLFPEAWIIYEVSLHLWPVEVRWSAAF